LSREVEQAVYFTNYVDMVMYSQDIFDHPVCIMKQRPSLLRHYYTDDKVESKSTGVSLIVYLGPPDNIAEATENFVDIYSEKGKVLV
jgi:hypothetical protein